MMQIYHLWNTATSVSFHTWDMTILLLYLFKIWKIGNVHKSKENRIWDNVLFILHRIVIITVFYTVCALSVTALFTILSLNQFSENTLINAMLTEIRVSGLILYLNLLYFFSILLMMDHNTNIYVVFLHFLRRFHLKYLCFCCYHEMVDKQLNQLDQSKDVQPQQNLKPSKGIESTMFPNLSINMVYTSDVSPNPMSPQTVTRVTS